MRIVRAKTWLIAVMALSAGLVVACGSDDPGASNEANDQSIPTAIASSTPDSGGESVRTGLDENCVQNVLGRAAAGFADVTDAERALVLEQCSGGGPAFGGGAGSGFLASLSPACVEETLGATVEDFRDISAEDRAALLEACAADLPAGGPGPFPVGEGPGAGGRGNLLFQQEDVLSCAEEELGRTISGVEDLSQEEMASIFSVCLADFGGGQFGGRRGDAFPDFGDGSGFTPPVQ